MGIELKLTDRELPVSPVFIDFLAHVVDGRPFRDDGWHAQQREQLDLAQHQLASGAPRDAERVMAAAQGRDAVGRAYHWLLALLTGNAEALRELQRRYQFINIIGIPRSGGSYLTQELFRALGHVPAQVHPALAHDGFPDIGPFRIETGSNSWVVNLQTLAEYLVMVETFFRGQSPHDGKVVVPKKLTKSAYAGGLFHQVLGATAENVLTVRHPVACCISTYEKSGGLPADGCFTVRSNIEAWCRRDLAYVGITPEASARMPYFDAYLRYWELYHVYVATLGLSANRNTRVVAYGQQRIESLARIFHTRYGSTQPAATFTVSDAGRERHREWQRQAEPVVRRVAETWAQAGLVFPLEEVMEVW